MKKYILAAATLLAASNAFAGAGSKNVMTCTDTEERVLTVDQLTGLTGGREGSLIATLQSKEGKLLKVTPVTDIEVGSEYYAVYASSEINAYVYSLIPMHLPKGQRQGKVEVDGKESLMTCTIAAESN